MKVKQLLEELAYAEPDAEVLLAQQPSWPMQYHVSDLVVDEATGAVYISEGSQVYDEPYLPAHVAGLLGWRDEPEDGGYDPEPDGFLRRADGSIYGRRER
jgi:hypothetical protein